MSGLPEQVQRQADEAEAIQVELAKAAGPGDADAQPPPQDPNGDSAQPPAPPAPAPAQPPVVDEKGWEHRYRTLQGMMLSQKELYEGQLTDLKRQMAEQDARIRELAAPKAPEPPKPAPVSQEDIDKFGPEIVDLITRQATQIAEQMNGPLKQELEATKAENAQLKQQVEGVAEGQGEARRRDYKVELTKLCPTWEAVNTDEAFHAWLAVKDPLSGATRQALLLDAFNRFDHERTAVIFNQYISEAPPPAPPPPPPPAPPAPPSLQSQEAPGASRVDTPPGTTTADKVWTTAEVEAFFAAVRRGDYSAADAARIEAEIDAAAGAGRIR